MADDIPTRGNFFRAQEYKCRNEKLSQENRLENLFVPEYKKPLGYVSLLNETQKPVYPLDDFFINYIFRKEENWQNLRTIINIFLEAYAKKYNEQEGFHFVDENITVETQYAHYLQASAMQPTQDLKINELRNDDHTYVEIQNKASSKPPVPIRASNYCGLAINKMKEGTRNSQIWLLAANDDNALNGEAMINFRWQDKRTGYCLPVEVNMMFISLPRLAEEKTLCGNLSKHILDGNVDELDEELKAVAEMFKCEFENFKNEEEVVKTMTIFEEMRAEAIAEGREEGREEGQAKLAAEYSERDERIIINRIQNKMPLYEVRTLAIDLGISNDRLTELLNSDSL